MTNSYLYNHLKDNEIENDKKIKVISEIIKEMKIAQSKNIKVSLNAIKRDACKKYQLRNPPKLVDIISAVPQDSKRELIPILRVKPRRTASGVAVVAVMCKPHRCPHIYYTGNICVYCPGGPDSDFEYSTQSYTGYEPTSMRAIRARYDPYKQARSRIEQLEALGHDVDKIEFIIMGGTFMSLDKTYRDNFIIQLHDALSGHRSRTLEEAILFSEQSMRHRCVGITIETRPDYCQEKHLKEMLSYGVTRLEIGLQSIYEHVALDTNRGHTVRSVTEVLTIAKNFGFKITLHMMPNLPNVTLESDLYQFERLFYDSSFKPDGLKIYPTLVMRGTGLYELWKTNRYHNYSSSVLIDLIAQILSIVPKYVRVYRIQRDIPMPLVSSSGVAYSHLRDLVLERMEILGLKCRDIRTREVGLKEIHDKVRPGHIEPLRLDYIANEGCETFLTYEDIEKDILIGLCRLRWCDRNPMDGSYGWSIVRELHVYGTAIAVHEKDVSNFQHQGFGTLLLQRAEKIAREEHQSTQLAVISGVGARNYYKKLGYVLKGPYMIKELTSK